MNKQYFKTLISRATSGAELSPGDMRTAMLLMLEGAATPVQIATFLTALKMRRETISEITAATTAMRSKAETFKGPQGAIDTCGTGGTGLKTLNISTAVAFVLAGCGIPVAKHGNKAMSSLSGSSDVLSELGVNLMADFSVIEDALNDAGICFLFAQRHHPAVKHVAPVRVEMSTRTIFNILGPLSNPANAKHQLMGVFDQSLCEPLAYVLKSLGSTSAWVVHGSDGLDELTLTGSSHVSALNKDGSIENFTSHPNDFGLPTCRAEDITGGTIEENARALKDMLAGDATAYRNIVLMNAAAGLLIVGAETDRKKAIARAAQSIDQGRAADKLKALIEKTNA